MAKKTPAYIIREMKAQADLVTDTTQVNPKPGNPKPCSAIPQFDPNKTQAPAKAPTPAVA